MKYIKKYENEISFTRIKKKYIVIKSARKDIPYYILKIKKIEDDTLTYSKYYYIKNGELINSKVYDEDYSNIITLDSIEDTIEEIIYQTDILDDAIEVLKFSNDINKYNI